MKLKNAPIPEGEEERECPICDSEGSIVLHEGDKVCRECQFTTSSESQRRDRDTSWADWHDHRDDEYDGFYGDGRIKFVGGFASAYEFGEDFF
jgi:hypothetical protein